nr:hypothetical protein [Tanacetum cinerariifolium]
MVNRVHVDYDALLWWDFLNYVFQKNDVIQYPRFTNLIIVDLMKKFPSIPQRFKEDYHSIKDDILSVSVYSIGNVLFQGMLILDAFLIDVIYATDDYAKYEMVFVKLVALMIRLQPFVHQENSSKLPSNKRSQVELRFHLLFMTERGEIIEATLLNLALQKTTIAGEAQENVAEVQEKLEEKELKKMDEGKEDKESYASEFADLVFNDNDDSNTRIEPGSHKENPKIVDDDDDDKKEKENKDEKKDDAEDKDNDNQIDHALVTTQETEKDTKDLIKGNLKRVVADTIIQERDELQAEITNLVSKEFANQEPQLIEELLRITFQTMLFKFIRPPSCPPLQNYLLIFNNNCI